MKSLLVLTLEIDHEEREEKLQLVIDALSSHAAFLSESKSAMSITDFKVPGIGKKGTHQATDRVRIDWKMANSIEEPTSDEVEKTEGGE